MTPVSAIAVLPMLARLVGRVPTAHLFYLARQLAHERPHRFPGPDGRAQVRLNTFFPPYPSPAFDRFCRAVIDRRRVPFSTYLAVTHACPFHCPHCSAAGRTGHSGGGGPMTRQQQLDTIRQIKALGTCTLGLTGGEPLLCPHLPELVAAAGPEMASIVFTTGHGLEKSQAQKLRDAGVTCVTIGLEAASAAEHDRVRGGAGSFDAARRAVAACQHAGIYTAISTVGTRERLNSGELERLFDLGASWGVGELRILAPVATGGWVGCASAMLSDDERCRLAMFHVEHRRRKTGPAIACFAHLESDALFGCGAGYHHLYIDAAGEVCPCDLTPLSFGNVTQEPLADIWQRMGAHFPRPRCGCLMGELARTAPQALAPGAALPVPREQSQALCPPPAADRPLPQGYRRLLRG